ncbi:metalloendoproteinase 2-MMP-like [Nymphaea colorata]|uniref:Peptidase M10 metallopeptidase domain-containing protein n=1 Tax=Nymphaea colorata TaxID=210225 RepID=A0A5K1G585_9MAGN|nr:metalloendoproteinase 2-MMP-like [Nymphaea colorata]
MVANLHFTFFTVKHPNCRKPFDDRGGTLAHSTYPPVGKSHYDADEIWVIDHQKLAEMEGSRDLQSLALHEIGHLLGLALLRKGTTLPKKGSTVKELKMERSSVVMVKELKMERSSVVMAKELKMEKRYKNLSN